MAATDSEYTLEAIECESQPEELEVTNIYEKLKKESKPLDFITRTMNDIEDFDNKVNKMFAF